MEGNGKISEKRFQVLLLRSTLSMRPPRGGVFYPEKRGILFVSLLKEKSQKRDIFSSSQSKSRSTAKRIVTVKEHHQKEETGSSVFQFFAGWSRAGSEKIIDRSLKCTERGLSFELLFNEGIENLEGAVESFAIIFLCTSGHW